MKYRLMCLLLTALMIGCHQSTNIILYPDA